MQQAKPVFEPARIKPQVIVTEGFEPALAHTLFHADNKIQREKDS